jgi:cytochrome c peroxidase
MLTLPRAPRHRRYLRIAAALCIGFVAVSGMPDTLATEPVHQVGVRDVREGYESSDFQTASRAVESRPGQRLDLVAMTQTPPLGLPPLPQRFTQAEVALGRQLFFDRRLSANGTLSCAMCHIPEQGFAQNELATPVGNEGRGVRRNAPSLYNVAYVEQLFLDGRESSLVAQVWSPLLADNEMANVSRDDVLQRLRALPEYRSAFQRTFSGGLDETALGRALAAYQTALVSAGSLFDRWYYGKMQDLSANARRGFDVFQSQGCASCHSVGETHALFTDGQFHNTGTGYRRVQRAAQPLYVQLAPGVFVVPTVAVETETFTDDGRAEVTGEPGDQWRYRTPSLRNVALTAPYMHDGSLATLSDVVDFYDAGGGGDPRQDARIRPLGLSGENRKALVAFLHALTGDNVDLLAADARSVQIGDVR